MLMVLFIIILLPVALICLIITGAIVTGLIVMSAKAIKGLVEKIKDIMKC